MDSEIDRPAVGLRDWRDQAVRFWERGRWIYLIVLCPPAAIGYLFAAGFAAGVGDEPKLGMLEVGIAFIFAFVGANLCYSIAYAIEFLVLGTKSQVLLQKNRRILLIVGCLLGCLGAFVTAQSIAFARYPP